MGSESRSFWTLSSLGMTRVYRKREQRTLNFVCFFFLSFLMRTSRASFRRATRRNCLMSVTCFGMAAYEDEKERLLPTKWKENKEVKK